MKTVGVNDDEGPPVPIPNTEVKLVRADNTWLETAREDRSTPTQKERSIERSFCFICDFLVCCLVLQLSRLQSF